MPKIPVPENDPPSCRLAVTTAMTSSADHSGKQRYPFHKEYDPISTAVDNPPSVRLAHVPGAQGDNNLKGQRGVEQLPDGSKPALLVSYYYLEAFEANKDKYAYRDWVMDSGAFSAHASGQEVDLDKYIAKCLELMETDPTLTEIYALDVIGSWEDSLKNTEKMWEGGVPAIPCFHYGEPWEVLVQLAKDYPKIAIGGCVGKRDKDKFAQQCFARVWPKKIHGFGFGAEKSIMLVPWHSVDATNWEMGPCAFGRWAAFGGAAISVRGSSQNLRVEVEYYLDLERRARERWKKEMAILKALPSDPSCRFVVGSGRTVQQPGFEALGPQEVERERPDVRLAAAGSLLGRNPQRLEHLKKEKS